LSAAKAGCSFAGPLRRGWKPRPFKAYSGRNAFAEKNRVSRPGAKALADEKGFIAALKALRHPKSSLFANYRAF
jgi:hypothetical protein